MCKSKLKNRQFSVIKAQQTSPKGRAQESTFLSQQALGPLAFGVNLPECRHKSLVSLHFDKIFAGNSGSDLFLVTFSFKELQRSQKKTFKKKLPPVFVLQLDFLGNKKNLSFVIFVATLLCIYSLGLADVPFGRSLLVQTPEVLV